VSFRRGHLDYFVAVAEEGQITRAAARLHVAQPALSQAMAQLESELGVTLLQRHARGVTLTPAGEAFLPKARAAVAANEDAALTAEWLARSAQGTIEFGFVGHAPALDSPGILDAFRSSHPDVDIRWRELPFPSLTTKRWLAGVDLAVCHRPPADPDTWTLTLREEPRVVLAGRSHPLAGREEVCVEGVLDQTFLGLHPSIEPEWAGFWSLNAHRGGPPARVTVDRARNPHEVLAALPIREAITTAPASVAALTVGHLTGVVAIPLHGADPAVITLSGHTTRENPVVAEMVAFAAQVGDFSRAQPQT
jgi:LysR family transcriptional regulator, benzoate and cis,cis-muconate-responsive activator of ben and cat genes